MRTLFRTRIWMVFLQCGLLWATKFWWTEKALLQNSHLKDFIPVCSFHASLHPPSTRSACYTQDNQNFVASHKIKIKEWIFNADRSVNFFSQISHLCGYLLICTILLWEFKKEEFLKAPSHIPRFTAMRIAYHISKLHLKDFLVECALLCDFKLRGWANNLWQTSHSYSFPVE